NETTTSNIHPCELYRNNGDGTFTEMAERCGVAALGMVKGVTAGDYDNDGRPDLYLSRKGDFNILFHNDGPVDPALGAKSDWKFTDVTRTARVAAQRHSFVTWFFDYDNDGWLDLFVGGYL